MKPTGVTESDLLAYLCGETDETRGQEIRCALEESPELASQASELLIAIGSLQGAIDELDIAFAAGEPLTEDLLSGEKKARIFNQVLLNKIASQGEMQPAAAPDAGVVSSEPADAATGFNDRLRQRWKDHIASADLSASGHKRHWARWITSSAAACLAVGLLIILVFFPTSSAKVYAISDMHQRIEQLYSLYLSGRQFRTWGTGDERQNPVESEFEEYFEQPNRYMRFSTDPFITTMVSDGSRYILINHRNQSCTYGDEYPIGALIRNQNMLQSKIAGLICGDPLIDYRYLRTEEIDGQSLDVYEQIVKLGRKRSRRVVIWFNPATGLPVKSLYYQTDWRQIEQLTYEIDRIEPNVTREMDPRLFDLPEDYESIHVDKNALNYFESLLFAGEHNGQPREDGVVKKEAVLRFFLGIDNRAMLVCWSLREIKADDSYLEPNLDDVTGAFADVRTLIDRKDTSIACIDRVIAVVPAEDYHWRWSVIVPRDSHIPVANHRFSLRMKVQSPGLTIGSMALELDDEVANQILAEPYGPRRDDGQPMTVEDIRSIIDDLPYPDKRMVPVLQ